MIFQFLTTQPVLSLQTAFMMQNNEPKYVIVHVDQKNEKDLGKLLIFAK